MGRLSVALVAHNEAANLHRTLESVRWADDLIVVDSGSTDDTVAIAQSFGAQVHFAPWEGYGRQVNRALDRCTGEWILNLDADEVVTPELANEIKGLLAEEPEYSAYWVPRRNQIFGRWMRHGGLYPDRKLRLFRTGMARLREDTEPHATPKTELPTGQLQGDLLHFQYPTMSAYIDHMDRYSTASVPLVLRQGKSSRTFNQWLKNLVLNPASTFIYNYGLRGGFLDGREGLLFHLNHSMYVQWKYAKAWKAEVDAAPGSNITARK